MMKRTAVVYQRDSGRLLKTGAFRILAGIHAALSLGAGIGIGIALTRLHNRIAGAGPAFGAAGGSAAEVMREAVGAIVPGMAGILEVSLAYLVLCWVLAGPLMTEEKASGTLVSLLATPLRPRELWLGKSAAVFVPGTVLAFAGYLLLVGVAEAWLSIATGSVQIVLPPQALITALVATPLLMLELILLTIWCAIALSPDAAVIPSLFLGFAIMIGVPLGPQLWNVRFDTWSVTLVLLGVVALFGVVLWALSWSLRKERAIRSA